MSYTRTKHVLLLLLFTEVVPNDDMRSPAPTIGHPTHLIYFFNGRSVGRSVSQPAQKRLGNFLLERSSSLLLPFQMVLNAFFAVVRGLVLVSASMQCTYFCLHLHRHRTRLHHPRLRSGGWVLQLAQSTFWYQSAAVHTYHGAAKGFRLNAH